MTQHKVKTILWDLDGTLLDSFSLYIEILNESFAHIGIPPTSKEKVRPLFHGTLKESVAALSGIKEEDALQQLLADFLVFQHAAYKEVEHNLFQDALELGRHAKGQGTLQIIVTNREHDNRGHGSPRSIVRRSSLIDFIDHVVSGDDGVHRKPKPAVIEEFLKSGKVDPATTIVIGDQFVDAEFAHNLGARGIVVHRGHEALAHMDKIADYDSVTIVKSLKEIKNVL